MQKHIEEMLQADIITPFASPWAFPALLVNKHDGSTRFVVDYSALNAATKFDSYPMPKISEILDQLNGKKTLPASTLLPATITFASARNHKKRPLLSSNMDYITIKDFLSD